MTIAVAVVSVIVPVSVVVSETAATTVVVVTSTSASASPTTVIVFAVAAVVRPRIVRSLNCIGWRSQLIIKKEKQKCAHSRLSSVVRSIVRASESLHVRGEPVMILSESIEEGHN